MRANGKRKIKILTHEEGRELLDQQARRLLGISGKEFIRRWKNEEFKDPDRPEVMQVAFLVPFGS